jgi:thiamine-phosphate pyrophosphorylase
MAAAIKAGVKRGQPLPRLWLMTDERMGEKLWDALDSLPEGGGVVFRHYSLPGPERLALFAAVRAATRGRRQLLVCAGNLLPGSDGAHGRASAGVSTASAHNLRELRAAERRGADLLFLSPVFATRSHPGRPPIGALRFALLARQARVPVVALGGMDAEQFQRLRGAYGWAGIDAWLR